MAAFTSFAMIATPTWTSLTDLGRIYGISAIHCGRALQHQGWRDRHGRPTGIAFEAGAAYQSGTHCKPRAALWNVEICSALLERNGYQPMSRSNQVAQWTQLLEALEEGSPSIDATPAQMAEDLPEELVDEVNVQLAKRGCDFRVPAGRANQPSRSASAC